jgi:hypothetical protein
MDVDANDLVAMLKVQRNAMADDAAVLKAMCDGWERRWNDAAALAERVAELTAEDKHVTAS